MLGLLAFYLLRPQPPPTVTLTAVPSTVEKVQSVTLSWTSQNATELDLEPAVGKVPAKGSWSAIPQGSGTFTLRATGPGGTQIATARVTVTIPPPPIPPSIPRVDPEATIRKLMSAWVEAFQTRNAYALAECYAPSVETYFKWHNSSNAQVRGTLERVFSTTAEIHQYEISDINILPSANGRYIATFGKEWDTTKTNGRPFSGAEIERLTFATFGSDWKIVREEEIRILHVMGHGG
jgi:ketosteroid isomerase-like protein